MKLFMKRITAAIVLTAGMAATAQAGTVLGAIDADFEGVNPKKAVHIHQTDIGLHEHVYAGRYNWSVNSDSFGVADPFVAFCIEISQHVQNNSVFDVFAMDDHAGAGKAMQLAKLWGLAYAQTTSADQAAGFQLAVWEIMHESGSDLDINAGAFYADGAAAARGYAQGWLDDLATATEPENLGIFALTHETGQDMMIAIETTGDQPEPVPSPAAGAGGLVLLAGLGLARRLRRRRD